MELVEAFGHGGDLETASRLFGVPRERFVDFSANINPLGPPEEAVRLIASNWAEAAQRYPDPAHRSFRRLLADKLHIGEEWLLVGNGAAECMALALHGLGVRTVGVVHPGFSEYSSLARDYDLDVVSCYGHPDNDYRPELADVERLLARADIVFLGHPNNPTGVCCSREQLLRWAQAAEEQSAYLAIDEAFIDFIEPDKQVSLLSDLHRFPRLLIIRSLTKFYAIPGLRLGYCAGQPDVIAKMKRKQVPWSVNQLALLAGEASLRAPDAYERDTRQLIARERQYLSRRLKQDCGWEVSPGEANFLLLRLSGRLTAWELQQMLGRKGILIRNCAMYPGLTEQHCRIAVKTREDNDKLLTALSELGLRRDGS